MKRQISDLLKAGYTLRDRAVYVQTEDDARAWKAEVVQWENALYATVKRIDPTDVTQVQYLGKIDHPISRPDGIRGATGPLSEGLPSGQPLKDDPVLDEHNTRLARVHDYLASLPRDKPPDLKVRIWEEFEAIVRDQPLTGERGEKTRIKNLIAERLQCDESRVRQVLKV